MNLEDIGFLFKHDPTFNYIFNKLPKGLFFEIVDKRRKRLETQGAQLDQLM